MGSVRRQSKADLYHVVSRGTGRQTIFEDDEDRAAYLRMLAHALSTQGAELYAYCLMSNHVHLLLHAPLEHVSQVMKSINGTYARYFNEKNDRHGHLFQERFRSEPIDDDRYLMTVICYIHNNPAKAGLANVEDYCWSSYAEYRGQQGICSTEFPLAVFGGSDGFAEIQRGFTTAVRCIDIDAGRTATRAMSDERAIEVAGDILGELTLNGLKELPVAKRDAYLGKLREAGLTIRQVERLTGIGRGSVYRAFHR